MAKHETIYTEDLLDLLAATRFPDGVIITVDGLTGNPQQYITQEEFSKEVLRLTGEPIDLSAGAPDHAVIRMPDRDSAMTLMKTFQDSSLYLRLYDRGRFIREV